MPFLPIAGRELLIQSRAKSSHWIRFLVPLCGCVIILGIVFSLDSNSQSSAMGKDIFDVCTKLAFVYSLLAGVFVTADSMSAERRENTLGLLYLTHLKPYDVVIGKLASSSLHTVYGLIALLPVLSISWLMGGVSVDEYLRVIQVLFCTLVLSLTCGIMTSTFSTNERKAVVWTFLILFGITVGPLALHIFLTGLFSNMTQPEELLFQVMTPSPIYGLTIAFSQPWTYREAYELSQFIAVSIFLTTLFLTFSCLIISRSWKDQPESRIVGLMNRIKPTPSRTRQWLNRNHRRDLLNRNAFHWLTSRNPFSVWGPWVLIVPLIFIAIHVNRTADLIFVDVALLIWFFLMIMLKIWFTTEVCNRLIRDRQSGALELLLSTPLNLGDIIRGQVMSLQRQFAPAIVTLVILSLGAIYLFQEYHLNNAYSKSGTAWIRIHLIILFADLWALRWVGLWSAMVSKGLNRAMGSALLRVLVPRYMIFILIMGLFILVAVLIDQDGIVPSGFSILLTTALLMDGVTGLRARKRFLSYARLVASNPHTYREEISEKSPGEYGSEKAPSGKPGNVKKNHWTRSKVLRFGIPLFTIIILVSLPFLRRQLLRQEIGSKAVQLKEEGIPVTISDYERTRTFLEKTAGATALLNTIPQFQLQRFQDYLFPPLPFALANRRHVSVTAFDIDLLRTYMKQNARSTLSLIYTFNDLSRGNYIFDYSSGRSFYLTGQYIIGLQRVMTADAILKTEDNRPEEVLVPLKRMVELTRSLESAPWFKDKQVSSIGFIKETLEWVLNRITLSREGLSTLEAGITSLLENTDPKEWVVIDRCVQMEEFTRGGNRNRSRGRIDWSELEWDSFADMAQHGFREINGYREKNLLDRMNYLRQVENTLKSSGEIQLRKFKEPRENLNRRSGKTISRRLRSQSYLIFYYLNDWFRIQATCRIVIIGLAVEQYRIDHEDRLPISLETLVPDYLDKVPDDPYSNQAVKYHQVENGYVIYCIGTNFKDDTQSFRNAEEIRSNRIRDEEFRFMIVRPEKEIERTP